MDTKLSTPTNTLVIDGCDSAVFVGLLDAKDRWLAKIERNGGPLEELFPAIEQALTKADRTLADIDSYFYCEGPGSVLGLRLCAMAIETWTRLYPDSAQLYKYNSLQLTAHALLHASPDLADALIVADWKKGAWNTLRIQSGIVGATEVIDDAGLGAWGGSLYHLPQRKGWQKPPAKAETLHYDPSALNTLRNRPMLLRPTDSVELYSSGINTFQKWTATRHKSASQS